MPPYSKSNQDLAAAFCATTKGTLIWEKRTRSFWTYNPTGFWHPYDHDEMLADIQKLASNIDASNRLTMGKLDDVANQCVFFVKKKVDQIDDTHISFKECLVNLTDWTTVPHTSEIFSTIYIDHEYATLAECKMPMFEAYLKKTCLDENNNFNQGMYDQLQEMAGYVLTPEQAEKAFILFGTGANGKSVFLEVLRKLITDDRCHSATIDQLTTQGFEVPGLIGKRANIRDEDESVRGKAALFKGLVSGNPITTRQLYGRAFTFRPKVKFYFGTQELPQFEGVDYAILRRLLVVPFQHRVDKPEIIRYLADKFVANGELPAIAYWALQGLKRLQANNFDFTMTPQSKDAQAQFEVASSSVLEFVKDNYYPDPNGRIPCGEIYKEYVDWCKDEGRKPTSSNRFGRDVGEYLGKSKSWSERVADEVKTSRYYQASKKINNEPQQKTVFD